MTAVIVSVGDELVNGTTIDAHSAYLAARLAERGIATVAHHTIGDDADAIAEALRAAAAQAEVILVTGGLGPTPDDVTREGLARATGRELRLDRPSLERIEAFFRARGRRMVEGNRIQAMIPEGAEPLCNEMGTAPGIAAEVAGAVVFCLPGVPHEMRRMFETCVAPRPPAGGRAIVTRVLHAFGAGESDVAAEIPDLMRRGAEPSVGITVACGIISLRITARGETGADGDRRADAVAATIRKRLGALVFGVGDETLAGVVEKALRARGQTLATAESCTGGLVGQLVTAVPGASDVYLGGVVAYADAVKRRWLDVPDALLDEHGAVSEPVAAAMADGAQRRFGADWAASITGIAGPCGGTDAKPVGLVFIALAGPDGTEA
ncbi:MAG: competence/damage-inducible protein A, partial [Planctomycetota bacterium]